MSQIVLVNFISNYSYRCLSTSSVRMHTSLHNLNEKSGMPLIFIEVKIILGILVQLTMKNVALLFSFYIPLPLKMKILISEIIKQILRQII